MRAMKHEPHLIGNLRWEVGLDTKQRLNRDVSSVVSTASYEATVATTMLLEVLDEGEYGQGVFKPTIRRPGRRHGVAP